MEKQHILGGTVMKFRNLALSILALALVGGATAGASEAVQTWKGKLIRVEVNEAQLDGGGLMIDGKAYLPVRALTGTLQALIRTEADAVHIYKPNVHLLLFTGPMNAMKPFGDVYLGTHEFSVLVQVDNMKTKVHEIRVTVVDPSGKVVDEQEFGMTDENRSSFWLRTAPFKIDFNATGQYKVKFHIKQSKDADYELISEKAMLARKKN